MRSSILLAASSLLGFTNGFGHYIAGTEFLSAADGSDAKASVLPPSKDPWYSAPAGFQNKSPGTILKQRVAPGNLVSVVANSSAAYNVLYRTTNSRFQPDWAVTTIFVPKNQPRKRNDSILSYQIPYDSPNLDTSPSYALYNSPPADIGLALGQGWYVNVPDYEGPKASFTAGVQSGQATLDSIRAVLKLDIGLWSQARYAMWGYSGGALASEWAAELQPKYAPDLKFAGTVLGGLTPNITSVLLTVSGGPFAGLGPSGIVGISSQFPRLEKYVLSELKTSGPFNKTGFLAVKNYTLYQAIAAYANKDLTAYFKNGIATLQSPIAKEFTNRDGIMGNHGVPTMPIFAYKSIGDDISLIGDTDALVKKLCAAGSSIWYQRNTVGNHLTEDTNGKVRAFQVLTAFFDQVYNRKGCTIENVTVGTA